MLFSCLAHKTQKGDVKRTLNVQKSSQSDKPILEYPHDLINKTVDSHLHRPESLQCMLMGVQWIKHQGSISYISSQQYFQCFQKKEGEADTMKGF
jgi:hypothetical protein